MSAKERERPENSVPHPARPWACTHNGPSIHPDGARFEVFCVHRGSAYAGCTQNGPVIHLCGARFEAFCVHCGSASTGCTLISEKTVYDLLPVSSTVHRMELSMGIFIDQADKMCTNRGYPSVYTHF